MTTDLREMQVHGISVDLGQDEAGTDASRRTYRAKDIGPVVTLIPWRGWAAAEIGPDIAQAALLADPGFVLPPEFEGLATCDFGDGFPDQIGKVFLCVCCATPSA